jgi:AbrB family looped-hinge helix DNA binding protein
MQTEPIDPTQVPVTVQIRRDAAGGRSDRLTREIGTTRLIHTMTSRVGERGQITIAKAIREELAIYAGDETVQRVEDGRIVIEVVPGRHRRSLAGSLHDKVGRRPPDESWDALRDSAWETPDPDRAP